MDLRLAVTHLHTKKSVHIFPTTILIFPPPLLGRLTALLPLADATARISTEYMYPQAIPMFLKLVVATAAMPISTLNYIYLTAMAPSLLIMTTVVATIHLISNTRQQQRDMFFWKLEDITMQQDITHLHTMWTAPPPLFPNTIMLLLQQPLGKLTRQ